MARAGRLSEPVERVRSVGPVPLVRIELVADETERTPSREGFLRVRRLRLRTVWPDGSVSREFRYDVVDRHALDAVVVALHAREGDERFVLLRSALRPPLALQGERAPGASPVLWELPAGLVEPDERMRGEEGLRACAERECAEETGLRVAADAFEPVGPPFYLTPGVFAERVFPFAAELAEGHVETPTSDGSVVEEGARCVLVPLREALAACADGRIADAKTEVVLRRLAARWARGEGS
ncbi:MAG: NUDIX hydrolase [Myxococcota bacterium]|nr:NUDIX hydrolase [Myxococcota bacterium]MDW8361272.1 NUDIX hydrolase [Myxococcales bacterium]